MIFSLKFPFFSQLFDHIAKAVITLKNTGKVGFEFCITDSQREGEAKVEAGDALLQNDQEENDKEQELRPGQPMVIPAKVSSSSIHYYMWDSSSAALAVSYQFPLVVLCVGQGFISAGAEDHLCVLYLPGVPEVFEKHLQLRVAHMPPRDIALTGEGVFPRSRLSLPQNLCKLTQ